MNIADGTADLQAGLDRLAPALVGGQWEAHGIERVSAGATQEIWTFSVGGERFVLRRNPPGLSERLTDTDMAMEATLIRRAEAARVPVAPVVHVLTPQDGLGEGFVSRFVAGETVGARIVRDPSLVRSGALAAELGAVLARVHATSVDDLAALPSATPQAMIADLRRRQAGDPTPRPVIAAALRWLTLHPPEAQRVSLVHGDYRIGNVIVDQTGVRAVLDWELAALGDPVFDLAWFCLPPWRFGAPQRTAGGVGDEAAFIAAYVAEGGERPAPERLRFWKIAGSARWALFCALGAARFASGEDRTPERALIARRASESEFDLVRLLEEVA